MQTILILLPHPSSITIPLPLPPEADAQEAASSSSSSRQHSLERCAQKATTLGRRRLGGRRRRRRGCRPPPPPPPARPRRPTPEVKQDGRFCSRQAVKGLFHFLCLPKNAQKVWLEEEPPPKMEEWRGGGEWKTRKKSFDARVMNGATGPRLEERERKRKGEEIHARQENRKNLKISRIQNKRIFFKKNPCLSSRISCTCLSPIAQNRPNRKG